MSDGRPEWDESLGELLLGAVVLVGITREGPDGTTQEELFGTVERADAGGVQLVLHGSRDGERYRLPADPRAFFPAPPGSYRLRSTGETVENPGFITTWTIHSPA